nr:MAG TPA: hypothetical protein [Caudoviricetes sp.]
MQHYQIDLIMIITLSFHVKLEKCDVAECISSLTFN